MRLALKRPAGAQPRKPLRERLAILKTKIVRPSASRRILLLGGAAAAVALPLPAGAGAPNAGESPELMALAGTFRSALAAYRSAEARVAPATVAYQAIQPSRPDVLVVGDDNWQSLRGLDEVDVFGEKVAPNGQRHPREVYTVAHLTSWLEDAGPRSRMRKFILRTLPVAEAYEAAEEEARRTSGIAAALEARRTTRERLEAVAKAVFDRPAVSVEGLAFKAAAFTEIRCIWPWSDVWLFTMAGRDFPQNVLDVLGAPPFDISNPLA